MVKVNTREEQLAEIAGDLHQRLAKQSVAFVSERSDVTPSEMWTVLMVAATLYAETAWKTQRMSEGSPPSDTDSENFTRAVGLLMRTR